MASKTPSATGLTVGSTRYPVPIDGPVTRDRDRPLAARERILHLQPNRSVSKVSSRQFAPLARDRIFGKVLVNLISWSDGRLK